MPQSVLRFHRFLVSVSFYPILLATGLALVIFAGRVFMSRDTETYRSLVWNLFLAWTPFIFGFLAAVLHRLFPRQWWLLVIPVGLWLIFFPNAPYIVTDFLHLEPRPRIPLWYDILLLATFSLTGYFLAIASLRTVQQIVSEYLGAWVGWGFAAVALALSGLGIYLGRFDRWNSWDLFFHPKAILKDIAVRLINPFDNRTFFAFTILFTALLAVSYFMFVSYRHNDENHL